MPIGRATIRTLAYVAPRCRSAPALCPACSAPIVSRFTTVSPTPACVRPSSTLTSADASSRGFCLQLRVYRLFSRRTRDHRLGGGGGGLSARLVISLFRISTWIIVALAVAGTALTRPCEEDLRCVDPGPIVIDEVMGMLMTLFLIPIGSGSILLGFLLFRALDVMKPFPARQLERLHGGFGVMADDAMAAIYADLLLRGAYYFAPGWLS